MRLGELLRGLRILDMGAEAGAEIGALAYDSRRVQPGTLFFAIQGEKADGHVFIPQALERGAVGIVSERAAPSEWASRLPPQFGSAHASTSLSALSLSKGRPELVARRAGWVRVPKIRRALADAARAFYNQPDSQLQLIGITGTNGKTTTAYLVESILRAAGIRSGLFGTIEHRTGQRAVAALNTTPESLDLISYFAQLVAAGDQAAVMEVSSHALAQERVWGFRFCAAVFTNLTRDHLDYHKDFDGYFAAKRRLFEGLGAPPPELAVINIDDPWGVKLLELPYAKRLTYGLNSEAQVKPKQVRYSEEGIEATLVAPMGKVEIKSALLGRVNLANILAATGVALGLDIPRPSIEEGIASLKGVPGRFQRIDEGQPFLVLVDYAHTDDALRNVLTTARELVRDRLIVVFGCGGERDRTKRPLMGEVAGTLSDFTVLTSDNPRSEDPLRIISDAVVGLQRTGKPYAAEVDREKAVRKALGEAHEGDVVVLAGKGHETYQVLKDQTIPFDDREVARRILREMGYGR
jgi:UDP-N-acetylmuramoyl-L-alanyl-D-glutamate--2,6-diaminopimelate ligase